MGPRSVERGNGRSERPVRVSTIFDMRLIEIIDVFSSAADLRMPVASSLFGRLAKQLP